ncbi:MAG: hypothetical protein KA206_06115 [Paludibacter sp.]|nr:hypothetical protein [Paludibacter sp.]
MNFYLRTIAFKKLLTIYSRQSHPICYPLSEVRTFVGGYFFAPTFHALRATTTIVQIT